MQVFDSNKQLQRRPLALQGPTLVASLIALMIAGCSDSSDSDAHADTDIDTRGRLALYTPGVESVSVLDLDAAQTSVLGEFSLTGEAPRLYASPDRRYAVLIQRADGRVSFLDSGLYTEDHGDHLHDYAEDPRLLETTLSGNKPTHYTVHEEHAAIFFDAEAGATSSVAVLSESSIATGDAEAELVLSNNMHGVAKLIDNQLFVTYRDPAIVDTTLPDEVERHALSGGTFSFEHRYAEQCPKLHGSAANEHWLSFGCDDGVLAIDLESDALTATHLGNPSTIEAESRIGTMVAHHAVHEQVAIAGDQYFVVDVENTADPYRELTLPPGVARLTQGFSPDGDRFYVLGNNGELHLFDVGADWQMADPIAVTSAPGEDDIAPAIAASGAENVLYLLETGGQQIKAIDADSGTTLRTVSLDAPASALIWLGLGEAHEHEDEHDEEHDHEEEQDDHDHDHDHDHDSDDDEHGDEHDHADE